MTKARLIKYFGNRAVHDTRAISENTATVALRELFHFGVWLVRTYAKDAKPQPGTQFAAEALPKTQLVEAKTLAGLQAIAADYEKNAEAQEEAVDGDIGIFIRSLVGLERGAAKEALAGFMIGRMLTANQIEFINLILDHLAERGAMDPRRLYERPFTDFDHQGLAHEAAAGQAIDGHLWRGCP